MPATITVIAPEGAVCGLYPQVPANKVYFTAIDIANALPATAVTTAEGRTSYYYAGLEPGLYHCAASMEGCCALCRVICFTGQTDVVAQLQLDKLAGNGYEAGYAMVNTQQFVDACLTSHKNAWGERYARLFQTPQFLRPKDRPGRHQQTTNEEMMDFIARLSEGCPHMHVYSLGKSPKYGYTMPLVLFTREPVAGMRLAQAARLVRSNGKPTVQYTAQCHSSEPASTEGALAMMLELCGEYGNKVLDGADVYIVPRINLDGAFEVTRKSPTTGDDMNRGYLRMANEELCMLNRAYNLFLPEIAIDGHERFNSVLVTGESICTDMELQVGAGSLNHPAAMTELGMKMALTALKNARALDLRCHFYGKLASAAGGAAGSSYYGTRNSLSFLVETPGQVHQGMLFMERRVLAQYILASTVITYAVEHADEILSTVHAAREHMCRTGGVYDENDCIVLEHGSTETGSWATPLIHVPTGTVVDADYACPYSEHTEALHKRPRATAYVLPQGLENEEEILRVAACHALPYYRLPAGSAVRLRQYLRGEEIALAQEQLHRFEIGAIVFPNTVPSTVLGVIMEPDFNAASGRKMTLLSMGLIAADEEGRLPLFRFCHDLQNGKLPTE